MYERRLLYARLFIVKKTDISFSSLQPALYSKRSLNRRQNKIPTFLSLSFPRMLPSLSVSYCPSYFLAPFFFNFSLLWYFWFGSTLLKLCMLPLLNWCCNMGKVFCYLVSYFVRTQICLEFFYPCYFWFFWNKSIRRVTYSKLISSILLILVKLHSAVIFYIDIFFFFGFLHLRSKLLPSTIYLYVPTSSISNSDVLVWLPIPAYLLYLSS